VHTVCDLRSRRLSISGRGEQAQLVGEARSIRPRSAVQLHHDVADVHLDRTRA
jgi:hypothetical protein